MKTTLKDLAKETGFSISTISRVLNGKTDDYRIAPETAVAIMEAVRKSNYIPPPSAQKLRVISTKTIGVILPSVSNPFFAELATSILSCVNDEGYSVVLAITMEDEKTEEIAIANLLQKKVDGIIAAPCGSKARLFESVNNDVVPVVLVDRSYSNSTISQITSNNYKGAYDATNMLISHHHRDIVCIQGNKESVPNNKRVAGYVDAMKAAGLDATVNVTGDSFSVQNGYLETKLLLSRESRPTAILALSYTILLGVLKALRESNVKVGEEMSLIAFDDNISMDYMSPAITRVSQPIEEMGRLAIKVLFDMIKTGTRMVSQIELSTELIVRDSIRML